MWLCHGCAPHTSVLTRAFLPPPKAEVSFLFPAAAEEQICSSSGSYLGRAVCVGLCLHITLWRSRLLGLIFPLFTLMSELAPKAASGPSVDVESHILWMTLPWLLSSRWSTESNPRQRPNEVTGCRISKKVSHFKENNEISILKSTVCCLMRKYIYFKCYKKPMKLCWEINFFLQMSVVFLTLFIFVCFCFIRRIQSKHKYGFIFLHLAECLHVNKDFCLHVWMSLKLTVTF